MTDLHELGVAEAGERIAARDISPVELVEALLARIDALDPRLEAWETVTGERALAAARAAEAEIARTGARSKAHGVPYGLKDIIDTAGIPTEAGSKVYAGRVPDADAHVVTMLDRAGAILLGKTVTTEFADGHPARSKNPWNPAHTPAGSSTGSGVAVAARTVPAALGTQTVGSVLRPAAYNGVVGFKPSFGRIGRTGVIPMSWSCDHVGLLVRSVRDAAVMLQVMSGHDPNDSGSADLPVPDFPAALDAARPPRLALLRGYFLDEADAETRGAVEDAAQRLAAAGADVRDADPGIDFAYGYTAHRTVQQSEMAEWHEPLYRGHEQDYLPRTREYLDAGFAYTSVEFVRAENYRAVMRDRALAVLADCDALMMPTASSPAPRELSNTGDTRFQSPWSFTGLPSIAIPIGLAANGLPLSLQFVGGRFGEEGLLAAAHWAEQTLGVRLAPPLG